MTAFSSAWALVTARHSSSVGSKPTRRPAQPESGIAQIVFFGEIAEQGALSRVMFCAQLIPALVFFGGPFAAIRVVEFALELALSQHVLFLEFEELRLQFGRQPMIAPGDGIRGDDGIRGRDRVLGSPTTAASRASRSLCRS